MSIFDSFPKHYDPKAAESLYSWWEENDYFSSTPLADKENYSILLPPPNVTGTLHMGHAFQHTLMDTLIRYHRMQGKNTLWQAGTDHAGIATQIVVTRELEQRGINANDISREDFLKHVWKWKQRSGDTISNQMRRLGSSCDWSRERFTMDAGLSQAVTHAFVQLYQQGLIYRGKRLVNWDPLLLTAVSDLEVVSEEEDGFMYYVRYPLVDEPLNSVVIGTTRPETILVDGAIAVHPEDERFLNLVGRQVWVPLTDPPRSIEIITDHTVDPHFGSGCVKISVAHDFNDYEIYQRHPDKNIPVIELFTPDAKMNDNAPEAYRGMDRFVARKQIVADLATEQFLIKQEPHRYKLPRGDRTGTVVEPMLTNQWFMYMPTLAKRGLQLVKDKKLRFVPQNWEKIYAHWLEHIQDWCISRQIKWGHRIPAWYDDDGNFYVAHNKDEAQKMANGASSLAQETDVLDTWFSSALWPFSTLGWPDTDNNHFRAYFPTSVLVTGFDIIFFWVARMAMLSDHIIGDTPFDEVYITGLVRDSEGQKMSKSKGNILDPLDIVDGISLEKLIAKRTTGLLNPKQSHQIEKSTRHQFPEGIPAYGVDALRFTFASLASYGHDIKFDLSRCDGYRHFCNKLWNACRYVLGVCKNDVSISAHPPQSLVNAWIISRLQRVQTTVKESFDIYRFDQVAHEIYQFFWNDYCDWYLEIAKIQLQTDNESLKEETRQTLLTVLETGLRLVHPLMPFISEQLWQKVVPLTTANHPQSIMQSDFPTADINKINEEAEAFVKRLKEAVEAARKLNQEAQKMKVVPKLLLYGEEAPLMLPILSKLSKIQDTQMSEDLPDHLPSLNAGGIRIALISEVNYVESIEKIKKDLSKIETDLNAIQKLLTNPQFLEKAKKSVIQQKYKQLEQLQTQKNNLSARL